MLEQRGKSQLIRYEAILGNAKENKARFHPNPLKGMGIPARHFNIGKQIAFQL